MARLGWTGLNRCLRRMGKSMSLEHTKWGWKARWRRDGLHHSKTFPTKEEAQAFDATVNRPMKKPDPEVNEERRKRAEGIDLELRQKIEESLAERVGGMRRIKS